MKNNKILIIITDGTGIRNYIFSGILENLINAKCKITIWSVLEKNAFYEVLDLSSNIEYEKINLVKEPIFARFWREISVLARLSYYSKKNKNKTILTSNWNPMINSLPSFFFYFLIKFYALWVSKSYLRILKIEKRIIDFWDKRTIDFYSKEISGFDKIFITHQRVSELLPLTVAAKLNRIEVTSVIYSWDNIPKARLSIQFDKLLVWSDYMKREINNYYPEILNENIIVTGTPQFDFFKLKNLFWSREKFALEFGLDINKKWVLFSGSDTRTSPYDPLYLEDLASCVLTNNLHSEYEIILRQTPSDLTIRYNSVIEKYEGIIKLINPDWVVSPISWSFSYPKIRDIEIFVNTVYHCCLAINIGSTIALDFGFFNKSCAYINYSLNCFENNIFEFEHFKSMPSRDCVIWINKKEDYLILLKNMQFNNGAGNFTTSNDWYNVINFDEGFLSSNLVSKILIE